MNIQHAIASVIGRNDLSTDEMHDVMQQIMTGEATPAQIGGFLIGLRMKGETVDEIAAAADVMRGLATRVELNTENLVDVVGTGAIPAVHLISPPSVRLSPLPPVHALPSTVTAPLRVNPGRLIYSKRQVLISILVRSRSSTA